MVLYLLPPPFLIDGVEHLPQTGGLPLPPQRIMGFFLLP